MTLPPGPDDRSDADLLAAHVAGDADAFGVLFARHRDRLWAVALRTMGNPEDAADGLQDGMIAAFRRAGSFRGEAAVTTWLHRVVVNACLDRIRAAKVRAADALPDDLEERADRGALVASTDAGDDPEASALAEERRRDGARRARHRCPLEQRAALVLVDMEGYSVAEAAAILELRRGHHQVPLRARPGPARAVCWAAPETCLTHHPAGNPRRAPTSHPPVHPAGLPTRPLRWPAPTPGPTRPRQLPRR